MLFVYNITSSWTELLREGDVNSKGSYWPPPPLNFGPERVLKPTPWKEKNQALPPLEQYMNIPLTPMRVFTIHLVELIDLNYYVIESKNTLFPSLFIYVCLYLVLFVLRLVQCLCTLYIFRVNMYCTVLCTQDNTISFSTIFLYSSRPPSILQTLPYKIRQL